MESEKFSSSGLYWLCKEAENRSSAADSPAVAPEIAPPQTDAKVPDLQVDRVTMVGEAPVPAAGERRRRGRPAKGEGKAAAAVMVKVKKKKKEDEDVCFICFDGGNLVLCDRGDCPKAYHPACIKRDEAFFRSNARWTCGWHICSKCQKSAARYMCYTCTYSLCKVCTKDADYLCVRENKGFCPTCFRVVAMIENIDQGNNETVHVDFDDKLTWEYLFKVYWICLKEDLCLTVDEITRAQKPWIASNKVDRRDKSSAVYYLGNNGTMTRENPSILNKAVSSTLVKSVRDNNNTSGLSMSWASKELLNFVGYMRNGDTSVLSQKEVQALLFDYIKRNNLRDPHQRSEIVCDSKLEILFGKPRVRHFEMLSLLEFHFLAKDESQKDEMQGDIIDPVVKQVAGESNSDNLPMISENYRHKVDKKHEERVDLNKSNEVKDTCEILENHVDSSGSTNNGPNIQACLKSQSVSGVKSETSVASLSSGSTPSANDREAENSWHYRDPKGKVQGPFAIEQLHKWSSTEIFPPNMRIWRLNTEEHDSVLLTDVIKGQTPLQNNHSLSPQEVKGASDCTSHPFGGPKSGSANSAGTDINAHPNGRLEIVNGNGPVQHSSNGATPVINKDPQINNDYQIKKSSKCWDSDLPKIIDSHSSEPQEHSLEQSSSLKKKLHGSFPHQDRSNAEQTCKPSPNNETRSSHGNTVSQTTSRQCHGNQIKEESFLGQPSLEGPLPQNSTVNNWSFNESHSRYNSNANLTDSSEQMISVDRQDFSMPMPTTSNGVLETQTVKEQERRQPPPVTVQKLGTQNVPSLMLETNTTVLENHTVKEQQRRQPPQVSVGIQNVLNLTPESNTKVVEEHTIKEQQMWLPPQVNVQNLGIQNVPSHTSGSNTGVLEARTIKEQQWCQPPQDAVQNLGIQNVSSLTPESNTGVLETHTIKEQQRWPPPQVSLQNLGIQNVLSLNTESDTDGLEAHTIKEQQRWQPPHVSAQNSSIQNVLSLTPKSIDHDERDFFGCQKMTSLTDRSEKVPATENQHSLPINYPAQDFGPSWSSVSNLVLGGGTHLPKKAAKSFMEEWDSGFLSVCSLRSNDVTTSTSKHDELPPPSPPNPVPNASSWLAMMTEPIEFNTLAEESVSDLLAEVDAMESNSDLESPNMLMDYADDLFHDSKTDCFTSLRGLSSPVNRVKNDAFSSSGDMMLPFQANTRDEQNREPKGDVFDSLKKSKRHSSTSSMMEVETKHFDNTANHFEYHSNKHNPSPPKKLRDQLDNPATQFEYRSSKHNSSPPKKIRDLADIMNAPTKHGNLNSPGSSRRESGQGTPRVSGGKNRGTSDGISVREGGHQKHGGDRLVSPRERNSSSALTSPRDRTVPGGDSGFNKGRQSWNRQSSFGSGGGGSGGGGSSSHSRSLTRGQRVCKFYESGYCRKGAFCDYLHP